MIACCILADSDWELLGNKTGATRLASGLLLKFFELDARFPRHAGEVPKATIDYMAEQVKVDPQGCSPGMTGGPVDQDAPRSGLGGAWLPGTHGGGRGQACRLAIDACPVELSEDRLREAVLARCRAKRSEPPGSSRVERILGNVFRLAEAALEQPDESMRKALNHTSS